MSQRTKRGHSSTNSEGDTSTHTLDTSIFEDPSNSPCTEKKKKKKQKSKKQKTMDEYMEKQEISGNEILEKKLDLINEKLCNVITKSDISLIREIVKDTINEMKDQFLSSIVKKIEVIEGSVHDRAIEIQRINEEMKSKKKEIDELHERTNYIRDKIRQEAEEHEKITNDMEQYSRRNNIRIFGVPDDIDRQTSQQTTSQVVQLLNKHLSVSITEENIDIAHRLGKFNGKNRPVIVKFVRRQVKNDIMQNVSKLKSTGLYISHDLTWLNQQVLSSLRLKDTERVKKCWCNDGILYGTFKEESNGRSFLKTKEVKFREYNYWLNLPWPERKNKK